MTGLEWIPLYEAFGAFQAKAHKCGLFADELKRMEDELLQRCPIQPAAQTTDQEKAENP